MAQKYMKLLLSVIIIIFIIIGCGCVLIFNENACNVFLNTIYDTQNFFEIYDSDKEKVQIKYNGTTIEEAVKTDYAIDEKAESITEKCINDREKAYEIYLWIGTNIKYDQEKAQKVLKEDEEINNSGAIYAFSDRKGICFDYAALYAAMAKKADLKVRLIVGEAYNGTDYTGHAWNEVYLQEEEKWINVDSTFFAGGDYFDSDNFDKYIKEETAGEW